VPPHLHACDDGEGREHDERELPRRVECDAETREQRRDGLQRAAEAVSRGRLDERCVGGEARRKATGRVLRVVEEADLLADERAIDGGAEAARQALAREREDADLEGGRGDGYNRGRIRGSRPRGLAWKKLAKKAATPMIAK